nr:UPF0692 protein C19orf54 homolog isoform X3 [Manis javanica]
MISPCSPSLEPPIPPARTPASQTIVSPPSLPPNLPNLTLPSPPSSLQAPIPPPPPLPPLPAAMGVAPPLVFGLEKSQLLKEAFEKAGPVPRSRDDVKRLLKLHKDRFRSDLQWILFCADLPSLIQEGPQCGLVALWMAGALLAPHRNISLEGLVQMAVERGYSAQGEMFSVADMGKLAQEALGCHAELLCGGLGGPNRHRVLQHLVTGHPLLIPYDEDFNHEPCQRKGHKAHWAVSAGAANQPPSLPEEGSSGAIYLLSKQGKSWHYQLWDYNQVRDSNLQLTDFSPMRASDGRAYVVPTGGVRAGLCGQFLLLRPQESSH